MKDAMGHEFGDDLTCECGINSSEHQAKPRHCRRADFPNVYTLSGDAVAQLRASLGIPLRIVAAGTGMSLACAARAVNGTIGGHGGASPQARARVVAFLDEANGD